MYNTAMLTPILGIDSGIIISNTNPRNVSAFGGMTETYKEASMLDMLSHKRCSKCGELKSVTGFSKNKRYSDGYQSYCKDCMSLYSKKWDENNSEKRKSIMSKWRTNNKSLVVSLARAWNVGNPERKKEINRNWNKNHPRQVRMMERNRDLREKGAPGRGVTEKEWEQLKADYHFLCGYCGKKLPLELDHIIPLSKGGAHEIENIIPACRACNAKKNNSPLIVFLSRILK
jgi:5-methylcytosine-specific restriction endonuclease McrA